MFPAGIETRVRRIVLAAARCDIRTPTSCPPSVSSALTRDSLLTFHADGSYEAQPLADGAPAERRARSGTSRSISWPAKTSSYMCAAPSTARCSCTRRSASSSSTTCATPTIRASRERRRLSRARRRANRRDRRAGQSRARAISRCTLRSTRATAFVVRDYLSRAQRHVDDLRQRGRRLGQRDASRASRRGSSSTIA